nr:MAG TPA: hypothetical protein [Caudoviricetes sp.]
MTYTTCCVKIKEKYNILAFYGLFWNKAFFI